MTQSQLANALGAAAVTTVYFAAVPDGGEGHALTVTLTVVAVSVAACLPLVRLLPRTAPEGHGH
ncbi:hypothetical protein [Streptomyces sp. NPDC049915]|uniref:hypothetical protein n=1 Tax=Streptomyces sp. NPDC049915 TaxID=3155510 RepID=UPI0034140CAB